jgi:Ca2+-transporting ATPase
MHEARPAPPSAPLPARRLHGAAGTHAWHALPVAEVVALLATDGTHGLSPAEARRRLAQVGPNRVGGHAEARWWQVASDQFRSLVVVLLLTASAIAWILGDTLEALAILAALLLNAAIGFGTEWRARLSLAKLRALAVPRAVVRRGGRVVRMPAADVVPGDLVVLEAGAQIPADARVIEANRLLLSEAALTGESVPVEKAADAGLADAPLADRRNMVYLGTAAVAGSGLAIVTATGLATELGRIGQLVALAGERTTPLERQVEGLGRRLVGLAVGICGLVGVAGILHGEPVGLMLETAVTLAIAAIPEGLPAVTTVALAAGLWRLARAGALVRRLPAVETLGSTTVVCSDKTGTMTENRMTATRLWVDGRTIMLGGAASEDGSGQGRAGGPSAELTDPAAARLLTVAALVNDASLEDGPGGVTAHGDPTEVALLVAARRAGLDPAALARAWPRRRTLPFDPATRVMATLHDREAGDRVLLVKGAPGAVLGAASHQETDGRRQPLGAEAREALLESNRALAREGLRVLALAWRPESRQDDLSVADLTFLGFVGLEDPIRDGVRDAVARCRMAGIRIVMLTGDQQSTAEAIGRQLGLAPDAVRSRVSPEDKMNLVRALQAQGEVVAMTGDGVNDAPALSHADIGIAMGRHGTDVARDAADLVLTDDNFATIVRAVEEGRVIYANLRKVIHFLFTCNLSEIATIFIAIVAGLPSPLLPLQILWVNLVTDILPAMALIRDPADPDAMHRPPRAPGEALVTWRSGRRMLAEGALLAAGVLSAFLWVVWQDGVGPRASTTAFVALVLIHPLQAMNCRSEQVGWWRLPPNLGVWGALAALAAAQWLAVSWAPLAGILGTIPLSGTDWLTALGAVVWPVLLLEGAKALRRPRESPPSTGLGVGSR